MILDKGLFGVMGDKPPSTTWFLVGISEAGS
jgi:hypothetical protein